MEVYWHYLAHLTEKQLLCARCQLSDAEGKAICGAEALVTESQLVLIRSTYRVADIEAVLNLVQPNNQDWLFHMIKSMLDSDGSLLSFHDSIIHDAPLKEACSQLQENIALMFRLMVLYHCNRDVFNRSLFCGWISLCLFHYMERDKADIDTVFEVSIAHDVGVLDLPQEVAEETHGDQQQHTVEYYLHAKYSADFMRRTGRTSEQIYQALCQHHEYIDGSGFPRGLSGRRLNEFGQIVSMFDSLYMVYTHKYKPAGRALADLVAIVEMNTVTRFGYAAKQLVALLKTGVRTRHVADNSEQVVVAVKTMCSLFNDVNIANGIIQKFTNTVGFRHEEKGLSTLQNGFFHIVLSINKSAHINHEFVTKITNANLTIQAKYYDEVEEAVLMMKEVMFHISAFKTKLAAYVLTCRSEEVRIVAQEALQHLRETSG